MRGTIALARRSERRAKDPRLDVIDRAILDAIDRHIVLRGSRQLTMRTIAGVVTRTVRTVQRRVLKLITLGLLKRVFQRSKWGDPEANRWVVVGAGGGGDMGVTTYARTRENHSPSERVVRERRQNGGRRRRSGAAPPAEVEVWTETYNAIDRLKQQLIDKGLLSG